MPYAAVYRYQAKLTLAAEGTMRLLSEAGEKRGGGGHRIYKCSRGVGRPAEGGR